MLNLRAYRLGFAPALAALGLIAFSVEGVPAPIEPAAGTIEFDASGARSATRDVLRAGATRAPGSAGSRAVADLVRDRFRDVASGSVAEQTFEASVGAEDVELRNVLLTLPGADDRTIAIIAGRDERAGGGAASSAAATGVLLQLAAELGGSERDHTLVFGSIPGADPGEEGVRRMLDALPEHTEVEVAVVVSQPGSSDLAQPHLVTSSTDRRRPAQKLIRTAEEALEARARVGAGLDGGLGQIARLALPAAAGAQAALLAEGIDAVAISSVGEAPLPPDRAGEERLSSESLERFGAAALALVGTLDAVPEWPAGPSSYLRVGDTLVPGWAISLLVLTLLIPPALPVAAELARGRRRAGAAGGALGWAAEWGAAALAVLIGLYALALVGLIPDPDLPFDPGRFAIGPLEALAILVLAGLGIGAWWALGARRPPPLPRSTLGAAAGAVVLAACFVAWLVNPFLALVVVPLAHVALVHAAPGARAPAIVLPVALVASLPLIGTLMHVAGSLDWGATAPWQLVLLVAGGGLGAVPTAALLVALAGLGAVARSAFAPVGRVSDAQPASSRR